MKKLGIFMKEKRKAIGLSLRDASNLTGVSHTHIRDIEDSRSVPSFEMVKEGYSMKLCFLKKREGDVYGQFASRKVGRDCFNRRP